MLLSFQGLSLAASLLLCGYLTYRCVTPPNLPPGNPYKKDRLWKVVDQINNTTGRNCIIFFVWTYHIALILMPDRRSNICLRPELLNRDLFTWSSSTILYISTVAIAAPIRLLAYGQLGSNFTFQLAKPDRLITTGLYHHVQHPSYTALFMLNCATYFFFSRIDGVAACLLPERFTTNKGLTFVAGILMGGFSLLGLAVRVRDEEDMLKKEYGEEWEAYHKNTRRFLPGII
jgi:protein-S-isoprenylcysteine O-methyltransferase Ste14